MGENYIAEFPDFRLNANPDMLKRWREIFRSKQHITVPARSAIVEQGKRARNLYYIENGLVEYTYIDKDGEQHLIEILGDYCVFPSSLCLGKTPWWVPSWPWRSVR